MSNEATNGDDADMGDTTPPKKPRRWVRWALVASLALNVLIIGFVASKAYHFSGKMWRNHSPVIQLAKQGRKFVHDLPRERRKELWRMIKSRKGEFKPDNARITQAMKAFAEAIAVENYDPDVAQKALLELQQEAEQLITRGRTLTLEVIAELTPAERAQLAARLLKKTDKQE